MTLKGHKNHYNIKLLRGYGVSINLKDHRVILKDGMNDITGKSEKEEWFVTQIPYEKIVISGKGYVSTKQFFTVSKAPETVCTSAITGMVPNFFSSSAVNGPIATTLIL